VKQYTTKLIHYKANKIGNDNYNNEYNSELYNVNQINSIYTLELNYSYYWDILFYSYTSFSARIIDLETSEILMSANFRGDKSIKSVLSEFTNKMSRQIR